MTVIVRDFAPSFEDIQNRFGKRLGRGAFRTVYAFGKDLVVKYERSATANRREWAVWQAVKGTDAARYLCPIYSKSADDRTLIQARCAEVFEQRAARISREIDAIYDKTGRGRTARRTPAQIRKLSKLSEQQESLRDAVYNFTREVTDALRQYGVQVYDLHEGNLGYDSDGNMIVIDYGNFTVNGNWFPGGDSEDISENDSDRPCSCTMCREASEDF